MDSKLGCEVGVKIADEKTKAESSCSDEYISISMDNHKGSTTLLLLLILYVIPSVSAISWLGRELERDVFSWP